MQVRQYNTIKLYMVYQKESTTYGRLCLQHHQKYGICLLFSMEHYNFVLHHNDRPPTMIIDFCKAFEYSLELFFLRQCVFQNFAILSTLEIVARIMLSNGYRHMRSQAEFVLMETTHYDCHSVARCLHWSTVEGCLYSLCSEHSMKWQGMRKMKVF